MRRPRNLAAALPLGAVVAALILAGCGGSGSMPTGTCTDSTRTAGDPGDAEPMLILGSVDFTPIVVYADGAVAMPMQTVVRDELVVGYLALPMMAPGYAGEQPGSYVAGTLTDCELEEAIERADALFTPSVDFGEPQVTDAGSTSATYDPVGDAPAVEISAHAFSHEDPNDFGGLSGAEQRARQDLADLWNLVLGAALTDELSTERLHVMTLGDVADDEVDWPLPPLSEVLGGGTCATISGDDVDVVVDLLEDRDGQLLDDEEYDAWRLVVVAVAPGMPDCT